MRYVWLVVLTLPLAGCAAPPTSTPATSGVPAATVPVPAALQPAAALFQQHCAQCHGADARGTSMGPPLIHPFYAPSHHGDEAFLNAALNGVTAHHWQFGDMPPVQGVTADQVRAITRYVRHVQQQAGLAP